ncbi:MAG TPA: tetratricopeptide repeat protein [Candidatus Acidoferrales bacterium]|nr:tetratricopeptide repeat protein [Candidatus Acidoferrales bacterium]
MLKRVMQIFMLSSSLVAAAWAAQDTPSGTPPPTPPPSAKDKNKSRPQGKNAPAQPRIVDSDAPPTPASPEEDMEVAEYYIHKGDPDAAIPRLEEAISQKPNLAKPRLMLAEIYEKRGDVPDALNYYRDYLKTYPSAPDAKKIQKKIEKLANQ